MFKNKFRLKKSKAFEDIHYSCSVQFLDDSPALSVTYQKDTKGQYLIDYVCQSLDLIEKDYFGLRYVNTDKQRCWLDPAKPVHGQLKGIQSPVLCFRVKYYPSDLSKLKEEITRYQLFLQVKKDLQRGRLLCSKADAIELCAYIVQSELGDYDPEEHLPNYVSEMKNLPKIVEGSEKAIMDHHKTLSGKVPAEAETEFLKKATELESYGMDPHIVMDMKGTQLYLAVNYQGITTFQNHLKTHFFPWQQIKRLSFDGRLFIVRLFTMDNEDSSLILKRKKMPTCGFKCESVAASKYLWKCAMEQKFFFTLRSATEVPKVITSGGFFHRSSKLRFSGRCEKEVHSSIADITRDEPRFIRSPSNADFARTYQSMRSATLPADWRQNASGLPSDEQIAILEMNMSEPLFAEMKESCVIRSFVQETVLEHDEDAEEKAEEDDDEKDDEGISTEPEPSEPATDNPLMVTETAIEETCEKETNQLDDVELLPNGELDFNDEESPTMEFLLNQPELDPEILALQTQLDSKLMDSINPSAVGYLGNDSEWPAFDMSLTSKEQGTSVPLTSAIAVVNPSPANKVPNGPVSSKRCRRVCYRVAVAIFFGIIVILLIAVFVLESKVDFPVVGHIRLIPAVEDFRVRHYIPLRDAAEEMIHSWFAL